MTQDGIGSVQKDGGFKEMGYKKDEGEQRRNEDTRWSRESAIRWRI